MFKSFKEFLNVKKLLQETKLENDKLEILNRNLHEQNTELEEKVSDKETTLSLMKDEVLKENQSLRNEIISSTEEELILLKEDIENLLNENDKLQNERAELKKDIKSYQNRARKFKAELIGIRKFSKKYPYGDYSDITDADLEVIDFMDEDGLIKSIIQLPLHSDNSKELKKLSTAVKKEIKLVLDKYEERYNTKSNKAVYQLMIVGLQTEIQLLLYNLSLQKLDDTKTSLKTILNKYVQIAGNGNQTIAPTLARFISEITPLYNELIDIEYKYYLYRQQEKEEQQAIKEQMKQEAEERKALESERKKLDKEESKYITEIGKLKEVLQDETDNEKVSNLNNRIAELESQLESVNDKKEEIVKLTLGKAGYVYIISNMGSFGDDVFKIGMTRRLEPQQRVDELGSASVPFKFDVHAMIFSDDAVGLENTLHKQLSMHRVNKVNFRKEFFRVSIDDLEKLVTEIDPTSDFIKTMYAKEYTQTQVIENDK